jgi:excisionase family DNA binding protein
MSERLLTPEQAAERLQLKTSSVRRQLQRGTLRGIKRGRVWRIPESALSEAMPSTASTPRDAPIIAVRAALAHPLSASERDAKRQATQELEMLFDQLNAEAEAAAGEPLPRYHDRDFQGLVAASYEEREREQ